MTVDDWVFDAVEAHHRAGATLQEVQRHIDEHHYEELAVDTIEALLNKQVGEGRLSQDGTRWRVACRTSKEEALRQLFGED